MMRDQNAGDGVEADGHPGELRWVGMWNMPGVFAVAIPVAISTYDSFCGSGLPYGGCDGPPSWKHAVCRFAASTVTSA